MSYVYSNTDDFMNLFNDLALQVEINSSDIATNLSEITQEGDVITIIFDNSLTSEEETILNGIISNHLKILSSYVLDFIKRAYVEGNNRDTFTPSVNKISSESYTKVGTYKYEGTSSNKIMIKIAISSYMESRNNGDYDIRLYDSTNNKILGEIKELENEKTELKTINNLSNLPSNDSIIEVQVRVSKKTVVYLDEIDIFYRFKV